MVLRAELLPKMWRITKRARIFRISQAMKAHLLAGFGVDPAVIRKTATRKGDKMRPFGVNNRELQIAVARCGIY
jgi:hypothetical protein